MRAQRLHTSTTRPRSDRLYSENLVSLESASEPLLRALVAKQGFDLDCLRLAESTTYRQPKETKIPGHFFGAKLVDLL